MKRIFASLLYVCLAVTSFATTTFAADGAARLLVLNKGQAELAIVDPVALKVIGRVPTGVGPHEVVTDGKIAVVANYGEQQPGNTLSVIDLATQKELRRVDLGALRRPHGMVLRGGKVYFTSELAKAVARYDIAADKVDLIVGTGQEITHMVVANADASALYTANILSDTVSALKAIPSARAYTVTTIAVGKGPEAIDMSPDGKQVWAAHSKDGGVSVIDTATDKVVATLPAMTKHSNRLKFTLDGRRVLISDAEGGEVVVLDVASRQIVKRIAMAHVPLGILMHPDGKHAFVATAEDSLVHVINLEKLEESGRVQVGAMPDGMAWSE